MAGETNENQAQSGTLSTLDKPKRWDLPFSQDLPNEAERRDLTETELDRLLQSKPFSAMDLDKFPKSLAVRDILRNDTRIRKYRSGDAVVSAGDYGNSAFLILEGDCRAIIEGLDQSALGRTERKRHSVMGSLIKIFNNPKLPEVRDAQHYPQMDNKKLQAGASGNREGISTVFVQDVPNVLELSPDAFDATKNNVMPQGSLFGELSALGRVQRSVTVVAADPTTTLLEIRWQGLRDLMKYDTALREHVNELFRSHGLQGALQASPILAAADLTQAQWDQVIAEAEFETYGSYDWYGSYQKIRGESVDPLSQEPIIAKEGHYPNGLVLIRAGFGRLSEKNGDFEQTFGYVGKGNVYGLEELLHNVDVAEALPLQSTLRAAGYTDIVRISTKTFEDLIYPGLEAARQRGELSVSFLGEQIKRRSERRVKIDINPTQPEMKADFDPSMMEFLVENRLMNGTETMMIDLDRCTRCDDCVRACASGHDNNPRFVRHGQIHGHYMIANACMHCEDPVCMIGCPTGAIHRTEGEGKGEVVINDLTCIGCGSCANSCPYENIRMVNVRDQSNQSAVMVDPVNARSIVKATKCDLCVDHHGGPACERACPHDALKRVDMNDIDLLSDWFNR